MQRSRLVGVAEIADLFGVTKQAVSNWRERREDFPPAMAELKSGPVWESTDIAAWAKENGMTMRDSQPLESEGVVREISKCVVVALTNMKGGVGKSTLAANFGWYCAWRKNMRVLCVDLDPQFNLSQYVLGNVGYEQHHNSEKPTIVEIFEQFTPGVANKAKKNMAPKEAIIRVHDWKTHDGSLIDLVPSKLDLAWTLKNPADKAHLLRDFLGEVKSGYDIVFIDCPPTESMLTTAAYLAADYLVVPVRPEFLSTIGLPLLMRSLEDFQGKFKNEKHPKLAGIIFNDIGKSQEHARSRKFVEAVAKDKGWYIFENQISHSDSYPAAARVGRPIFLKDYARWWKKAEFNAVAVELLSRVGL